MTEKLANYIPDELSIDSITLEQVQAFLDARAFDRSLVPGFDENFLNTQKMAANNWVIEDEIPEIENEDVTKLQARIEKGILDIDKPFSEDPQPRHPFPEGLSGFRPINFLEQGLKKHSGEEKKVSITIGEIHVTSLKPMKRNMFFDTAMAVTFDSGLKESLDFIRHRSFFIISRDNFIIDGHLRFLVSMLFCPDKVIHCLRIDQILNGLLP